MEPEAFPISTHAALSAEEADMLRDLKRRLLEVLARLTGDKGPHSLSPSEKSPRPDGLLRQLQASMDDRRRSIGEMQGMMSHLETLINGTEANGTSKSFS